MKNKAAPKWETRKEQLTKPQFKQLNGLSISDSKDHPTPLTALTSLSPLTPTSPPAFEGRWEDTGVRILLPL